MDNLAVAHLVLRLTLPPPNEPSEQPKIRRDTYYLQLAEAETGTDAVYKIIKHLYKWDFPSKEKHLEERFVDRYEHDMKTSQNEGEDDQDYEWRMQWIRDWPYRKADCQARWLKCAVIMGRALDFLEKAHREYGDLSGKSGIYRYHYNPRAFYEYIWVCLHQGNVLLTWKERFLPHEEPNSGAWYKERIDKTIQRAIEKWHKGFNLDEHMLSSIPTELRHGLVSLPNELKFSIAELLSPHDLAAFAQTSPHFSDLAIRKLYQQDAKSDNPRALIWAVANGQKAIAEKALKAGTDVSLRFDIEMRDRRFRGGFGGFLHLAIVCSKVDARITIPNHDEVFIPFVDGNIEGRMAVIRLLFNAEAEVNLTDNEGRTPLSYAAYYGLEPMVKMLLDEHAKINCRDNGGNTPRTFAIESRSEAVVRLLLEARAKVNVKDEGGETPLLIATQYGSETIVKLLLEAKAKVNIKDHYGRTPLMCAALYNFETAVRLLLEAKAKVNSKTREGETALVFALYNNSEAMVRLLLEARAKVNVKDQYGTTPLFLATQSESETIVQLLLEAKAKVNVKSSGQTPLMYAVASGSKAIVRLLLEARAKVNLADLDQSLSLVAEQKRKEILELLLAAEEVEDRKSKLLRLRSFVAP